MLVLFVIWLHIELAPVFGIAASSWSHPQVVIVLFNPKRVCARAHSLSKSTNNRVLSTGVCVSVCVSPYVWTPSASGIRDMHLALETCI